MRCIYSLVLVLTGFALATVTAAHALEVADYSTQRNDRFADSPLFIGDYPQVQQTLDFSGVGQTTGGQWVTMISPKYFLSAAHYAPEPGDTVTFYSGNSASPQFSYTYTISSWSHQLSLNGSPSDLYMGELASPINSSEIATYPVLGMSSSASFVGDPLIVYGGPNQIGTNSIASVYDLKLYGDSTWCAAYDYSPSTPDSAYLEGGDSGAPSFVDMNGQLAVAGIHYVDGTNVFGQMYSGDSFVPYYIPQLMASPEGGSIEVAADLVPEPSSLALLIAGALGLLSYAWRRQNAEVASRTFRLIRCFKP